MLDERGVERVHWKRGTEADAEVARAVQDLLRQQLTVDVAVQIALLNNRNLQATYEGLGIAQADLVQAGLLSNPTLHAEVRFPAQPRLPIELDITKEFLDLLVMPLRKRMAAAEFAAAKQQVAHAVLTLARDTRVAFYRQQAAEQMLEMRRSVLDGAATSADVARRLHEAGNITELALANEQVLLGQAKLDLAAAEADESEEREELIALLGLWGHDTQFEISRRLPDLPAKEITPTGLESLAVAQRLDLAAARNEIEALAQSVGIDGLAFLQGLGVTAHLEREPSGTTTTGPSLEIPIPLFDTGSAARHRAAARLRQSTEQYAALAIDIRSEVRRHRDRMLAGRERAEYFRTVVVPLRTRIVEESQLEYNGMLLGVFQLLQAKQSEIDAGRDWIEALRDYWIARAQLESAVGGRFSQSEERASASAEANDSAEHPPVSEPEKPAKETEQHHHSNGDHR
jgi:cobalt-zinc-cadmium efflux system outer membrane protein